MACETFHLGNSIIDPCDKAALISDSLSFYCFPILKHQVQQSMGHIKVH
jgi:hypothetical protein